MTRSIRLLFLSLLAWPLLAFNWDNVDMDKVAAGGNKLFKASKGMTEAQEIQLGREVAANLAARYSLVNDAAKLKYLHMIALTLARHTDRKSLPYHVAILRSSEINAYAAPGGFLFITQGLLNTLQDESELAGVLAHEMTHVTHKHILTAIRKANLAGAGKDLAEAGGADLSAYAPLSDFSIKMLSQGLSRKDELDADKGGTTLAAASGYDPQGLERSIQRLSGQAKAGLFMERFQKTHPPAKERLSVIEKVLHRVPKTASHTLTERFVTHMKPPAQPEGKKT